jgi:hypothetical protein
MHEGRNGQHRQKEFVGGSKQLETQAIITHRLMAAPVQSQKGRDQLDLTLTRCDRPGFGLNPELDGGFKVKR